MSRADATSLFDLRSGRYKSEAEGKLLTVVTLQRREISAAPEFVSPDATDMRDGHGQASRSCTKAFIRSQARPAEDGFRL